jgi:phosphatidylglycerophosphate synthase
MTPIAVGFGKLGITPNGLTLIGFGIAVIAAGLAAAEQWLPAGLLVVFGGVFDLFDGALARATNRVSRTGAFMDSVFDRWGEGVVYIGIAWGAINGGWQTGAVLVAAAMSGAFMVSYTRAKAESLGFAPGTGMANVGLAPREIRIVILTIGLILTGLAGSLIPDGARMLGIALGLIAVLATITTIQRIVVTMRQAISQEQA